MVVDPNVLLNLSRYDDGAGGPAGLFQALGDRLFVPHQVASEFWRDRASATSDRLKMASETVGRLEDLAKSADQVISRMGKSASR